MSYNYNQVINPYHYKPFRDEPEAPVGLITLFIILAFFIVRKIKPEPKQDNRKYYGIRVKSRKIKDKYYIFSQNKKTSYDDGRSYTIDDNKVIRDELNQPYKVDQDEFLTQDATQTNKDWEAKKKSKVS